MIESPARQEILRRVKAAKGAGSEACIAHTAWNNLPREYKHKGLLGQEAVLELLEDRLRDYDAHVVRASHSQVAENVAERLTARARRRIVLPAGIEPGFLPEGFDFIVDNGLSAAALDEMDGVLTESTVAIAETGTIILHSLPGQGRRALTLVPDYHLCLVRVKNVVETVPEAMDRIKDLSSIPMTFVSGPSATADIEMTRIKGVHGPRHLDVILMVDR